MDFPFKKFSLTLVLEVKSLPFSMPPNLAYPHNSFVDGLKHLETKKAAKKEEKEVTA
jgi:hypothetical protein